MINRPQDIQIIKDKIENNPGVCILGPRQVGKTTIAKSFQEFSSKPVLYLDLENPEDIQSLSNDPVKFLKYYSDQLIIIDEVQFMPELFSILRPIMDENNSNSRFMLLGSASPALITGVSESLAGRVSYFELSPLRLLHIISEYKLETHWVRGGYPRAFLANNDQQCYEWCQDFIFTYTRRELSSLLGVNIDSQLVYRLWQMLAARSGNLHNASDLSRSLGTSVTTINRYVNYLIGAYLILELQPWFANVNKRLTKSPKLLVKDSGLHHALLGIKDYEQLIINPDLGSLWETYVINQIINELPTDIHPYFYRTQQGAEIDLLLVKNGKPYVSIEIKYSSSPRVSRGFYNCITDLKTEKNFIVTPSTRPYPFQNLFITNLTKFISNVIPTL